MRAWEELPVRVLGLKYADRYARLVLGPGRGALGVLAERLRMGSTCGAVTELELDALRSAMVLAGVPAAAVVAPDRKPRRGKVRAEMRKAVEETSKCLHDSQNWPDPYYADRFGRTLMDQLLDRLLDAVKRHAASTLADSDPKAIAAAIVLALAAHPHQWNGKMLDRCLRCGAFKSGFHEAWPCDPSKITGKTEPCCECGEDYPHADLIAGHIYCPTCRGKL